MGTVIDYYLSRYSVTSDSGRIELQTRNRVYSIDISRGIVDDSRTPREFEPVLLEAMVSCAPGYTRSQMSAWAELHLAEKIAEKWGIAYETQDDWLVYQCTPLTKVRADEFVSALKQFDAVSHSPEYGKLADGLERYVNRQVGRILKAAR